MSHGRHARPGLAQKAASNTGPIVISGAVAAGIVTTGAFPAITAQASATAPATPQQAHLTSVLKPTFTPYTVKGGDTLSGISDRKCGTWNDWPAIYDMNKNVIGANPNLIRIGQRLKLICKAGLRLPDPPARTDAEFARTANTGSLTGRIARLGYTWSEAYAMAYTALFLYRDGYSAAGAAGVVSCIAGESAGNVESIGDGGGGLIGWTPLPYGMVTGNVQRDLETQLAALLHYNDVNGPTGALKSMSSPDYAADFYSQHFERPAVTDSDVRYDVAQVVFAGLP